MTYRQVPHHGHHGASTPPAKRSKQISVTLEGGPRGGDRVPYGQPLPKVLVVKAGSKWVEYYRKPGTTHYVSADDIPSKEDQELYKSLGLEP